ncbi:TetR/AcrR family transcriptional regulator [Streptomyces sp. NBC_01304]|uniref:TetR/AcrR family transcriptional regulator n=1 Tax=Streptomyces sp. NBC_01304 TaxID=2903818 RepID=UPI002E1113C3|nr:TetR/AcrR family transcriptional regulator [Streptomyces sp. NBC_01304]
MTLNDHQEQPQRGRPRSEAVEHAIIEGVMQLLEDGVSLTDLSIERVARTAGVGKATIYRRWKGKEELMVDVIRVVEPPEPVLPGTSARDDLIALLESLRQRGLAARGSALLHNVFAQMKALPKLWAAYQETVIEARRRMGLDAVRRGIASGEIRADIDVELAHDLITGPMLLHSVLRPDDPLDEDLPRRIVDGALDGLRPRD